MTEPISELKTPPHLMLVMGALSLATVLKYVHTPDSLSAGAWPLLVLVASYLVAIRVRLFGWFSVGGVTVVLSILAFWLKWLLDSEPRAQLRVLAYDNNDAIRAYAIFLLVFALAWRIATRSTRELERSDATRTTREQQPMTLGIATVIFLSGLALVGVRLFLANVFQIGLPGVAPSNAGGLRLLLSLLYYLSIAGPLASAGLLAVYGPPRVRWVPAVVVLMAFAAAGAYLGYRSYAMLAFITVAFAVTTTRSPRSDPIASRVGKTVVLGISLAAAIVALNIALANRAERSGTGRHEGTAAFLSERVGGLDYLSPVVTAINRTGPSLEFLNPAAWDVFMRVSVYGFPSGAITGVSATLPGLLYGIQGIWGLLLGGWALGLLAGWLDRTCLKMRRQGPVGVVVTLGALLFWTNLLGEGTLRAAILQGVGFLLLAAPLILRSTSASYSPTRTVHSES